MDVLPLDRVLDLVPGADRLLRGMTHGSLERVLRLPGVADQLGEIVRRSGGELTIEFAQEALSALSFEAGQGAAQLMDPDDFGAIPVWDAIDNLEWEFEAVMAAGGGMIMLPGTRIARAAEGGGGSGGSISPKPANRGPGHQAEPQGIQVDGPDDYRAAINYSDLPEIVIEVDPVFDQAFEQLPKHRDRINTATGVYRRIFPPGQVIPTIIGDVPITSNGNRQIAAHMEQWHQFVAGAVMPQILQSGTFIGFLPNRPEKHLDDHNLLGRVDELTHVAV